MAKILSPMEAAELRNTFPFKRVGNGNGVALHTIILRRMCMSDVMADLDIQKGRFDRTRTILALEYMHVSMS